MNMFFQRDGRVGRLEELTAGLDSVLQRGQQLFDVRGGPPLTRRCVVEDLLDTISLEPPPAGRVGALFGELRCVDRHALERRGTRDAPE